MASLIRIGSWLVPSLVLLRHGVHKVLDWPGTVDAFSVPASLLRDFVAFDAETIARVVVGSEAFCGVLLLLERGWRAALATAALLVTFTVVLVLLAMDNSWNVPCPCTSEGGLPIWLAVARNVGLVACCYVLLRCTKTA